MPGAAYFTVSERDFGSYPYRVQLASSQRTDSLAAEGFSLKPDGMRTLQTSLKAFSDFP